MRLFACLFLLFSCLLASGQKKKACCSFDDMPVVCYVTTDANFQKGLIDKLIKSLKKNKIPAIGFVNE